MCNVYFVDLQASSDFYYFVSWQYMLRKCETPVTLVRSFVRLACTTLFFDGFPQASFHSLQGSGVDLMTGLGGCLEPVREDPY